jgi:hypothetical protein
MINGMMVSTETHSVRQVAEDFLRWREAQKAKKSKKKPLYTDDQLAGIGKQIMAQAATKVKSRKVRGKRKAAFDMYMAGASTKDVAATLCVSYANAHYYKRMFNKEYR